MYSTSRSFKPHTFLPGELKKVAEQIVEAVYNGKRHLKVTLFHTYPTGGREQEVVDIARLDTITEIPHGRLTIRLSFDSHLELPTADLSFFIRQADDGYIEFEASGDVRDSVERSVSIFESALQLNQAESIEERARQRAMLEIKKKGFPWDKPLRNLGAIVDDLIKRIEQLERSAQQTPLTVFLSFRFENKKTEEYGRIVKEFLESLDIRVVTGKGFEPRPISDKVADRLKGVGAIVVIFCNDDPVDWFRDEMGRATGAGAYLFPLVEEGATFKGGIYGDTEYIRFAPEHVSDAFQGLVDGIHAIRRIASASEPGTDSQTMKVRSAQPSID